MRILNTLRCLRRRSEDTTDESHRTASTWHRNLRLIAWSRGLAPLTNATSKKQKQQKNQQQQQGMLDAHCQLQTGNNETDSGLDKFQTLMSKSIAPLRTNNSGVSNSAKTAAKEATAVELVSANNRSGNGKSSKNDPNSLAASSTEKPSKLLNEVEDKRPRFRFGPRCQDDSDDKEDVKSIASSTSTDVDTQTSKYAFIYQDGKLVEREVYRWPRPIPQKPATRYKLLEPYASNYGKAKGRLGYCSKKYILPRTRFIYHKPIFMLRRSIVDENKRRLLARHMFKDHFDPITEPIRLPMSVSLEFREQCMKQKELQKLKYIKEAIELIAHGEEMLNEAEKRLD